MKRELDTADRKIVELLHTAMLDWVWRNSGSRVKRPIRIALLSIGVHRLSRPGRR